MILSPTHKAWLQQDTIMLLCLPFFFLQVSSVHRLVSSFGVSLVSQDPMAGRHPALPVSDTTPVSQLLQKQVVYTGVTFHCSSHIICKCHSLTPELHQILSYLDRQTCLGDAKVHVLRSSTRNCSITRSYPQPYQGVHFVSISVPAYCTA